MSNDFVWKAAGCGGIRRFLFLNCELRRDVAPAFQSHPSALPTISISDFSFQKNAGIPECGNPGGSLLLCFGVFFVVDVRVVVIGLVLLSKLGLLLGGGEICHFAA